MFAALSLLSFLAFIVMVIAGLTTLVLLLQKRPFKISGRVSLAALIALVAGTAGLIITAPPTTASPSTNPGPTQTPQPVHRSQTPSPTPSPTAAATDSEALQKFRNAWMDIAERTASAIVTEDRARQAIAQTGNAIDASDELKKCQDAASGINDDAVDLGLDMSNDSDNNFRDSLRKLGDGLGYGCKSLRSFLDTQAPSEAADARQNFKDAIAVVSKAQFMAEEKYKSMGGDPHALLDFKSALHYERSRPQSR